MQHFAPFEPRAVLTVPLAPAEGWQIKQYAVLSEGRTFDAQVAEAARAAALKSLPAPGDLQDGQGNHGVGFQVVHFAQTGVVVPVFYWQWGSVLAQAPQERADWQTPTVFGAGAREVVGCVWEMEIVTFEVEAWKTAMLGGVGGPDVGIAVYLDTWMPGATRISGG